MKKSSFSLINVAKLLKFFELSKFILFFFFIFSLSNKICGYLAGYAAINEIGYAAIKRTIYHY